ncbi:MAG: sigma-54-dependent Fis family transcriptional regulator, partial [Nitrospirae bacterium]|nr:sigma-54-dependent Fis family transcriptional regulator [Nitrospirota bacterium]
RDRKEDIPLLANHFLKEVIREQGLKDKVLTDQSIELMKGYEWPGNVRELRNLMERVAIMTSGDRIYPGDLSIIAGDQHQNVSTLFNVSSASLREARTGFERYFILEKLKENNWNITKTAEDLKIERSNLHRKIKLLGLEDVS